MMTDTQPPLPAETLGESAAGEAPVRLSERRGAEVPEPGRFGRWVQRMEARISKLSVKNNFWHRVCSLVFLPLAFRSGIKFKRDPADTTFSMVLPFRRFNKNWYNAMAGAALLANSEVAGGSYVFGIVGADYTVVCKELNYQFRRPCVGPAVYRVTPLDDVRTLMAEMTEFNVRVEMDIYQAVIKKDERERRVGRATATFHVAPKAKLRERKHKLKQRARDRA